MPLLLAAKMLFHISNDIAFVKTNLGRIDTSSHLTPPLSVYSIFIYIVHLQILLYIFDENKVYSKKNCAFASNRF